MKRYIILMLTMTLATLAGCQKDVNLDAAIDLQEQCLMVSLPCQDESTRVSFTDGDNSLSLDWEEGDAFTVYDTAGDRVADFEYYATDNNKAIFAIVGTTFALKNATEYVAVYPAIDGVATISDHRTELANRAAEQSQEGNESSELLDYALRMEAQFTYHADANTEVDFEHYTAAMRITFALEDGAIPTKLEFRDGDYATYTVNMNETTTSSSYTAYYVINPNEGGERTLSFIFTTSDDELQLFSVTSSVAYSAGECYTADVPGLTIVEIPDGYTPIYTALELYNVRNNLSGNYVIMNDIDLSSYTNWTPIGSYEADSDDSTNNPFTGIIDGANNTIAGLAINTEDSYQGLFGYSYDATFKNITIQQPSIVAGSYAGSIIGYANGSLVVDNCKVEGGSLSSSGSLIGGLIGQSYANSENSFITITNCSNSADITGTSSVAGVAGRVISSDYTFDITISNCYNEGEISGESYDCGGIVGRCGISSSSVVSISNCYNVGNVSGSISYSGGVVGHIWAISATVTACYNTGDVTGDTTDENSNTYSYIGGVIGRSIVSSDSSITDCYNTGEVSGSDSYVGGVVGYAYSDSSVTSCYNTGEVSGSSQVGGVIGYASSSSSVTSCYNTGEVSGTSDYVGGVVGYGSVTDCYNTGEVSGTSDYVGGVVGYATSSSVTSCYYLTSCGGSSTYGGTSSSTLISTMTSSDFPETLNTAAGDTYFEQDSATINDGYPILISIDYTTN